MSTSIGSLLLELKLDATSFNSDLAAAKRQAEELNRAFQKNTLTPKVNHQTLIDLNKHLESKVTHVRQVQQKFDNNPLRVGVDFSQLDELSKMLKALKSERINVKVSGGSVGSSGGGDGSKGYEKLADAAKSLNDAAKDLKQSKSKPLSGGMGIGLGIGQYIGTSIAAQVAQGVKRNFNVDLNKVVGKGLDKASVPIKLFITENPDLKNVIEATGKKLDERLRKAGYKVADGVIAAIEEKGKTITQVVEDAVEGGTKQIEIQLAATPQERVDAFVREGMDFKAFKAEIKEIIGELKTAGKEARSAVARKDVLESVFEAQGNKLREFREITLKERAIPLVRQRAAEILEQKRAKDSAKVVTDDTKEFLIVTGGYAGARGLSGKRLATDIRKDLPDSSEVIWTKNSDTDLPKEVMGDATEKAKALLMSLNKPNLRGYSKDAVEMAAQGLAAVERNPEITIKLIGESGGGFVAEEAAKILQMMGVKNVQYLGVGTPDFVGRLNAPGQKMMSPDEYLGAETHGRYARLGLANTQPSQQNILGVEGHPFEHYQEAQVAELENFIKGAPAPFSKEELNDVKRAADMFRQTDTSEMSSKQIAQFNKQAYANMQLVRRHLLAAEGDLRDELQEISDAFESVYVQTAETPRDIEYTRSTVKQAKEVYSSLVQNKGLQSGDIAGRAQSELKKIQAELQEKYKDAVGTAKRQFKQVNDELSLLIEQFGDPSLGIRQPAPAIEPEVLKDEIQVIEKKKESLIRKVANSAGQGIKDALAKVGDGIEGAIVNRVNDQLMRVPGNEDVIDVNANQVGALSELGPRDYGKLARLGAGDTMSLAGKGFSIVRQPVKLAAQGLSMIKGAEESVLDALPGGHTVKGALQGTVMPALLQGAGTGVGKVAALGGQAAIGAANALMPSNLKLTEEQIKAMLAANAEQIKALLGTTSTQIQQVRGAIQSAKLLASADPKKAAAYIESAKNVYPRIAASVDNSIAALPPEQRMMSETGGANLANLKSQLTDVQRDLAAAEERATKLTQFIGGIMEAVKNPIEVMNRSVKGDYIDAEVIDVTPINALPDMQTNLKNKISATVKSAESQLAALGKAFSTESAQLKAKGIDPVVKADVAAKINNTVDAARQAITDILEAFGESAPKSVKKAAKSARQSITAAEKSTSNIVQVSADTGVIEQARNVGVNVGEGVHEGISGMVGQLRQSGTQIADVVIEATEQKLEIKSPSRVFQRIGEMAIKGLEIGLQNGGAAFRALEQEIGKGSQAILNKVKTVEVAIQSQAQPDLQKTYESIAESVASLSGVEFDAAKIPKLADIPPEMESAGRLAEYNSYANTIFTGDKVKSALSATATGSLDPMVQEIVSYLIHELRHAFQMRLGEIHIENLLAGESTGVKLAPESQLPEHLQPHVQASVDTLPIYRENIKQYLPHLDDTGIDEYVAKIKATVKALEVDAYHFQSNLTPRVLERHTARLDNQNQQQSITPTGQRVIEQAKSIGANIGQGVHEGVSKGAGQLRASGDEVAQMVIRAAKSRLGIKSPSTVFKQIGEFVIKGLELGLQAGGMAFQQFEEEVGKGSQGVLNRLKSLALGAATAFLAFNVVQNIIPVFQRFTEGCIEAAIAYERLQVRFKANLGASSAGALEMITDRAVQLRTDIDSSRESYIQFAAALKGTPLEYQVDSITEAIDKLAIQQTLSIEQKQRAQAALVQIAGKGKVYSEEIFGQLAEAVPSAPQTIARAMGTDVTGLRSKMASGQGISSEQFLSAFSSQVGAEASLGMSEALNTTAASAQNLANQFKLMQESIGKAFLPVRKLVMDVLAFGIEKVTASLQIMAEVGGAALIVLSAGFARLIVELIGVEKILLAVRMGFTGLGKAALAFLNQPANSFAGWTLGLVGVIELFKLFKTITADAGGSARKFVQDMDAVLAKSRELQAQRAQQQSGKPASQDQQFGDKSSLETFLPFQVLPYGDVLARGLEFEGQKSLRALGRTIDPKNAEDYGVTKQEKENADKIIARNEAIQRSNEAAQGAISMLQRGGDLSRVAENQNVLRGLQSQRANLNPVRADGKPNTEAIGQIEAIDARMKIVHQNMQEAQTAVRSQLQITGQSIEGLKQLRDEAVGDPQAYKQYSDQIKVLTDVQDKLRAAIDQSVTSIKMLDAAMEKNESTLAEATQKIDLYASNARESIYKMYDVNADGQKQFANDLVQQIALTQKLAETRKSAEREKSILQDTETQRVLNIAGFDSNSAPSDIRDKATFTSDQETKDRLNKAAEQIDKVNQLNNDAAQRQAEIAASTDALKTRIKDLTRQVTDFNRQTVRGAEDVLASIEIDKVQRSFEQTRAKLNAEFSKFSNSYSQVAFDMVNSIAEFLNDVKQIPLKAQQKIRESQRSVQDLNQQGDDMKRNLPTGGELQFGGGGGTNRTGTRLLSTNGSSPDVPLSVSATSGEMLDHHREYSTEFGTPRDYVLTPDVNNPALDRGAPIYSPTEARVRYAGPSEGGYGNMVELEDKLGQVLARFAHLDSVSVKTGDVIQPGAQIGGQGSTGGNYAVHLHLEASDKFHEAFARSTVSGNYGQGTASQAQQPQQRTSAPVQGAMQLDSATAIRMATLAGLEAPSRLGRLDVVANVMNRYNAPRVGLPSYGSNPTEVMFAKGQYQSYFKDPNNPEAGTIDPNSVSTLEGAAQYMANTRGMSVEVAKQIINSILTDMQNPELMRNAIQHVGGRLSFKGVTEYPYRVPSEDPLRADGENFFHIDDGQTYSQLDKLAQLGPTAFSISGVSAASGGGSQSGIGATGSIPDMSAQRNMVDDATNRNANAQALQQAEILKQAQADTENRTQELNTQLNQQIQTYRDNTIEMERKKREQERAARDEELNARRQTPDVDYQRTINRLDDQIVDLKEDPELEKLKRSADGLRVALERAKEQYEQLTGSARTTAEEAIKAGEGQLAANEKLIAQTEKSNATRLEALEKQKKIKQEDFEFEQKKRQLEAQQGVADLQGRIDQAKMSILRRQPNNFTAQRGAGLLDYNLKSQALELELQSKQLGIEDQLRNADPNDTERIANLQKQLELLKQMGDVIREDLKGEFDQYNESVGQAQRQMQMDLFNGAQAVRSEQSSGLRAMGFTTQANEMDASIGRDQINANRSNDLANAEIQYKGNPEALAAAKQNIEGLANVKLDNLTNQFSVMGQLLPGIQSATAGLFSGILAGTQTAEEAFRGFLGNLAEMFANLAAQMITNQVIGMIMGIGGASAGAFGSGGMGFGGMFGLGGDTMSAGLGFAEGGMVGKDGKKFNSLDEALRREGPGGRVIVAHKDELILPPSATREFYAMGLDKVLNFKDGGMVGGKAPSVQARSMGSPSASVTVNVENKGREMDEKASNKLGKDLENAVIQTLMKQGREGGFLYAYVKEKG